jgi:hypothetical protein
MNRTKKIVVVAASAVAVFSLTGCASDASSDPVDLKTSSSRSFISEKVPIPDGSYVYCVRTGASDGGVSCDWEHPINKVNKE